MKHKKLAEWKRWGSILESITGKKNDNSSLIKLLPVKEKDKEKNVD